MVRIPVCLDRQAGHIQVVKFNTCTAQGICQVMDLCIIVIDPTQQGHIGIHGDALVIQAAGDGGMILCQIRIQHKPGINFQAQGLHHGQPVYIPQKIYL
jgi:hypothetical protein